MLTVGREDEVLLFKKNRSIYIQEAGLPTSTILPDEAVIFDSDLQVRYCLDNDEESIYSIDKASLNIFEVLYIFRHYHYFAVNNGRSVHA